MTRLNIIYFLVVFIATKITRIRVIATTHQSTRIDRSDKLFTSIHKNEKNIKNKDGDGDYYDDERRNDKVNDSSNHDHHHRLLDFLVDFHGIPNDSSNETCIYNTQLLTSILMNNSTNNTIIIPSNEVFYFYCGIYGSNMYNTVLQIDGTIRFERNPDNDADKKYPHYDGWHTVPCIMIDQSFNITITSSHKSNENSSNNTNSSSSSSIISQNDPSKSHQGGKNRGLIDGRGSNYWGVPGIGYIELVEYRPDLFRVNRTTGLLIENVIFQDSPYHTMYLEDVHNVEIRYISIVARRTKMDGHSLLDMSAFNTDGIDVSGSNVHVHDIDVWAQDDCIAVKDNWYQGRSEHMLFENINASGMGFVIGSIGNTTVQNITFRNSLLYKPMKGVYMKFHSGGGIIDTILYDNITVYEPSHWPIWIGPAQQSDGRRPCHANPCSLCWPYLTHTAKCNVITNSYYSNITLKDVTIYKPILSPGVILGSPAQEQDNEVSPAIVGNNYTEYSYDRDQHEYNKAHIDGLYFHNVQVISNLSNVPTGLLDYDIFETFPGLRETKLNDVFVPNVDHIMLYYTIATLMIIAIVITITCWCLIRCIIKSLRPHQHHRANNNGDINTVNLKYRIGKREDDDSFDSTIISTNDNVGVDVVDDKEPVRHATVIVVSSPKQQRSVDVGGVRNGKMYHVLSKLDDFSTIATTEWNDNDDDNDDDDEDSFPTKISEKKYIAQKGNKQKRFVLQIPIRLMIVSIVSCIVLIASFSCWIIMYKRSGHHHHPHHHHHHHHHAEAAIISDEVQQQLNDPNIDNNNVVPVGQQKWGSWDDTTQYYQCTGVMNGVASGTTWPVPSCFQDQTNT